MERPSLATTSSSSSFSFHHDAPWRHIALKCLKVPMFQTKQAAETQTVEATILVALLRTPLGAGIARCPIGVACDIKEPPSCFVPAVSSPSS